MKKLKYNLNSKLFVNKIKDAKKVVLQFPDGLKAEVKALVLDIEKKTNADIFLWMGSNFGGCDYPFYLDNLGFDLIINVGHNKTTNKVN